MGEVGVESMSICSLEHVEGGQFEQGWRWALLKGEEDMWIEEHILPGGVAGFETLISETQNAGSIQ